MSAVPTTMQWIQCAVCRVYDGSKILALRQTGRAAKAGSRKARAWHEGIGAWLKQGSSGANTLLRYGFVIVGALVLWKKGPHVAAWLLEHALALFAWAPWPFATTWVVAAYRAGDPKRTAEPEQETESETVVEEPEKPAVPFVPRAVFLALLHRELEHSNAVHLSYLAEWLNKHYPEKTWDVPAVRELCDEYGVPWRQQVRAHGNGPTRGVKKEDIPPLGPVSMSWSVDVDAAGQMPSTSTSTDGSTAPSTDAGEEQSRRFHCVDDAENPYRTHVVWPDRESA